MRVVLALLLLSCSSGGSKQTVEPTGSGSAAGSAVAASTDAVAAAKIEITAADQLATHAGASVDVVGTARNAKLAAAVVLSGTPVYCLGVDSWPSDVANKQVAARGTLEQTNEFAAEGGGAGTSGGDWVLRGCTYETR